MSKNKHKDEERKEVTEEKERASEKAEKEADPEPPKEKETPEEQPAGTEEKKADPKDEEIARLQDQLMRSVAEYDNYRKRTAKERTELTPEITARIVGDFLPVLDSLERALQADCADANYKTGVQMIYDTFMQTLDKLGVEKVPAEDFDPSMHQAVQQVSSDDLESGKIASVFQNGYRIGSRVLRFAMVSVVS